MQKLIPLILLKPINNKGLEGSNSDFEISEGLFVFFFNEGNRFLRNFVFRRHRVTFVMVIYRHANNLGFLRVEAHSGFPDDQSNALSRELQ